MKEVGLHLKGCLVAQNLKISDGHGTFIREKLFLNFVLPVTFIAIPTGCVPLWAVVRTDRCRHDGCGSSGDTGGGTRRSGDGLTAAAMSDLRDDPGETRTASNVAHRGTLLLTLLVTDTNLVTVVSRLSEFPSRRTTSTFGVCFTGTIGVRDTNPFLVV